MKLHVLKQRIAEVNGFLEAYKHALAIARHHNATLEHIQQLEACVDLYKKYQTRLDNYECEDFEELPDSKLFAMAKF